MLRRLVARFRRDRLDDLLHDEIQQHIELRRDQLIRDGIDPREADAAARRAFGQYTEISGAVPRLDPVVALRTD